MLACAQYRGHVGETAKPDHPFIGDHDLIGVSGGARS
jgi:hypothetical protein